MARYDKQTGSFVYNEYYVGDDGEIKSRERFSEKYDRKGKTSMQENLNAFGINEETSYSRALQQSLQKQQDKLKKTYEDRLEEVTSRENTYNTLAEQIAALTSGVRTPGNIAAYQNAMAALSGQRNYGSSDLSSRLNFQISDQQIIDDFNQAKIGSLNRIVSDGNAQIAGISERLNTANTLFQSLPEKDPRRTSSEAYIKELQSDLRSVQSAVANAQNQITNFTPITANSEAGLKEITSFREFVKLPEERASEQLRQIDPQAYETAKGLGQQYRNLVTQELPATTTPQTEQLRQTIEQEALNQLRLGSTLGAEERRGYEQAIRAAQTARGNIFGLGPAVQEAAQLGAAGEQRKLARYGAAQQFLASGETTGAAAARDLALREGLTQQRLGAASGFLAGGPSLANLAQQRLGQQNLAAQQYIQANQPLPGQFQTQGLPNQFYQTTDPRIPVQLASNAANIYNTMSNYQAETYGAQTRAIASQPTGAQQFGSILSGISGLIPSFSFSK